MRVALLLLAWSFGSVAVADEAADAKIAAQRKAMPKDQSDFSDQLKKLINRKNDIAEIKNALAKRDAQKEYAADVAAWSEAFIKYIAKNGMVDWVAPADVSSGLSFHDGSIVTHAGLRKCPPDVLQTVKKLAPYELVRFTIAPNAKLTTIKITTEPFVMAIVTTQGPQLTKVEPLNKR